VSRIKGKVPYEKYWQKYIDKYGKLDDIRCRPKRFYDMLIKYGFKTAKKMTGYSKYHALALLWRPGAEEYMLGQIREAAGKVGLTLQEILKKRYEIACNEETRPETADKILKDLQETIAGESEALQNTVRQIDGTGNNFFQLKPAKEVEDAEFEDSPKEDEKATG